MINNKNNASDQIIEVERLPFVERAEKILWNINDPLLLALKVHLLIEEAPYECLTQNMKDPKYVEKARLNFSQELYMLRAMHEVTENQEKQKIAFYGFAEALNTFRNRYAHNIQPAQISDLFPIVYIRSDSESAHEWNESTISDLMISISMSIGYFWARAQLTQDAFDRRGSIGHD